MPFLTRRDFLHDSAALTAALAGAGLLGNSAEAQAVKSAVPAQGSANDQLRVACMGVRGQGRGHVTGYAKHNAIVTTICDVDEGVIAGPMREAEKLYGKAPKYEKDIRKVLEDKSIDCISIATPNHWHALAAIWAMQAGKHVYVEKPVSHNVREGRLMVDAARKYNKICQTGTQSRSQTGMRQAIEYILSGKLGKVQIARGLCYKDRPSIGKVNGDQQPPKTMDYDLWCGPAPNNLPRRNTKNGTVHYDWHWIWDYGNGDLGNQGIHEMDKARWGLGKNGLPKSVISVGGRLGYVDDGQTPNTQVCIYDYGDSQLIFEVRGLKSEGLKNCKIGNIFHCEKGYLVCPDYFSGAAFTPDGQLIEKWQGRGDHFGNFIKAVRSGKASDLHADILEGHLSSALCHLGNISYRLGKPQPFSAQTKAFGDDKEAYATLERMFDHLKQNKVAMDNATYMVGPKLELDFKAEMFVNSKEANAMLTREYRKGFEVPQKL
jgi:predicted dehydrogenase